jgi:hypothetical protein
MLRIEPQAIGCFHAVSAYHHVLLPDGSDEFDGSLPGAIPGAFLISSLLLTNYTSAFRLFSAFQDLSADI